jgi:anti-sigma factor ChrR (cupin superfamily)
LGFWRESGYIHSLDLNPMNNGIEIVELNGTKYAEIIWSGTEVKETKFFSAADSSFQFGLLAHEAGFVEAPHYHKSAERTITDLQQMFVVQRGVVAVDFFDEQGKRFREVVLRAGDGIVLVHGTHSVRVLEDMQCISVKQGPFLGASNDKIEVEVNNNQ